jgi:hypothetical protein
VNLRALLVFGLLAGLFAPRWLPQPLHASCCCPAGMEGACSRTKADCSLKRCMPDGAAAISISAARLLVPTAQTLPAPAGGELVALFDAATALAPPDDPSDPPPRARA